MSLCLIHDSYTGSEADLPFVDPEICFAGERTPNAAHNTTQNTSYSSISADEAGGGASGGGASGFGNLSSISKKSAFNSTGGKTGGPGGYASEIQLSHGQIRSPTGPSPRRLNFDENGSTPGSERKVPIYLVDPDTGKRLNYSPYDVKTHDKITNKGKKELCYDAQLQCPADPENIMIDNPRRVRYYERKLEKLRHKHAVKNSSYYMSKSYEQAWKDTEWIEEERKLITFGEGKGEKSSAMKERDRKKREKDSKQYVGNGESGKKSGQKSGKKSMKKSLSLPNLVSPVPNGSFIEGSHGAPHNGGNSTNGGSSTNGHSTSSEFNGNGNGNANGNASMNNSMNNSMNTSDLDVHNQLLQIKTDNKTPRSPTQFKYCQEKSSNVKGKVMKADPMKDGMSTSGSGFNSTASIVHQSTLGYDDGTEDPNLPILDPTMQKESFSMRKKGIICYDDAVNKEEELYAKENIALFGGNTHSHTMRDSHASGMSHGTMGTMNGTMNGQMYQSQQSYSSQQSLSPTNGGPHHGSQSATKNSVNFWLGDGEGGEEHPNNTNNTNSTNLQNTSSSSSMKGGGNTSSSLKSSLKSTTKSGGSSLKGAGNTNSTMMGSSLMGGSMRSSVGCGRIYYFDDIKSKIKVPLKNDSPHPLVWRIQNKAGKYAYDVMPSQKGVLQPGTSQVVTLKIIQFNSGARDLFRLMVEQHPPPPITKDQMMQQASQNLPHIVNPDGSQMSAQKQYWIQQELIQSQVSQMEEYEKERQKALSGPLLAHHFYVVQPRIKPMQDCCDKLKRYKRVGREHNKALDIAYDTFRKSEVFVPKASDEDHLQRSQFENSAKFYAQHMVKSASMSKISNATNLGPGGGNMAGPMGGSMGMGGSINADPSSIIQPVGSKTTQLGGAFKQGSNSKHQGALAALGSPFEPKKGTKEYQLCLNQSPPVRKYSNQRRYSPRGSAWSFDGGNNVLRKEFNSLYKSTSKVGFREPVESAEGTPAGMEPPVESPFRNSRYGMSMKKDVTQTDVNLLE